MLATIVHLALFAHFSQLDPPELPAPAVAEAGRGTPNEERHFDELDPHPTGPEAGTVSTADAFCELPSPRLIHRQGEGDTCSQPAAQKVWCYSYRFEMPAHFPLNEFGPEGEPIEREGALIYEGMRFSVDRDGTYELGFVVTTPRLPTRLHLQLEIVHQAEDGVRTHTLTLPPIEIRHQDIMETRTNSFSVTAHGFSDVLQAAVGTKSILEIRRTGVARFGYARADVEGD